MTQFPGHPYPEGGTNHFGRLLRFWRAAFNLSQEDLAGTADVSVRHLSFLETGKAQPSRALIDRITAELELGRRDAGNLLQAAGYLPLVQVANLDDPGNEELRRGLVATLRCFDPFPAAVIDPFANVKMVNKAWVYSHRRLLGDGILRPDINTIRLLVAEDGWRRYMPDWAQVVCLYLVILQQEAILRDSFEASALLDEILATEGIPADWARRGARTPSDGHNHAQQRGVESASPRTYINVHHTVGSTAFVSEPRLILHGILPEDGVPDVSLETLNADASLIHPLLAY